MRPFTCDDSALTTTLGRRSCSSSHPTGEETKAWRDAGTCLGGHPMSGGAGSMTLTLDTRHPCRQSETGSLEGRAWGNSAVWALGSAWERLGVWRLEKVSDSPRREASEGTPPPSVPGPLQSTCTCAAGRAEKRLSCSGQSPPTLAKTPLDFLQTQSSQRGLSHHKDPKLES